MTEKTLRRCRWVDESDPIYVAYHDKEWGVPVHEDRRLFELLVLETFQAGLPGGRCSTSGRISGPPWTDLTRHGWPPMMRQSLRP